jgi:uncharacterized RDD family membrane protein YckC
MEPPTTGLTSEPQYPLLSERVQSTFIDTLFVVLMMFIFSSVLDKYPGAPVWVRVTMFIGICILYEPVCTCTGFTLGNYIKGLRVRQFKDPGRRINFIQAFFRYLTKLFLGWLSFLSINTNKERRAIHDFLVGSLVIKL